MKKLNLPSLSLRAKVTLIVAATTTLVAVSMFFASHLLQAESERQAGETTIKSKTVLWSHVASNHYDKLRLGIRYLSRDRPSLQALSEDLKDVLAESISTTHLRLSASEMLNEIQVTDKKGLLVYSSNEIPSKVTDIQLVHDVLRDSKILSGVEKNDAGGISLMTVFPLYSGGQLVGAGVYEKKLKTLVKDFIDKDSDDTLNNKTDADKEGDTNNGYNIFVIDSEGKVQFGSDMDFYKSLSLELPALGEEKSQTFKLGEKIYTAYTFPIKNYTGTPIAHMVSINDTTKGVIAKEQIQFKSYSIIFIIAAIALLGAYFYMRYLFSPLGSLMDTVAKLAGGNIFVRAEVVSHDEIGQLSKSFNDMAQQIQDSLESERQYSDDVKGKVELILEVVEKAAEGDLSTEMMIFSEEDAIGSLSRGIQKMLDNLNALVAKVQESGVQVASSANQIAATAKQQEATINEQAATTNEIVATAKEISSTSKELLHTMDEVTEVSHNTSIAAESGRDALGSMEGTMNQMVDASSSITSKLAVLNEKAKNINSVVTTITKVADQTNLLSLNAAIEAEKAGEYGVGFSVVATEIRRLADQTAVATWDIEQIVQEIQSAVSAGVMGMDKFSEEIRSGVADVNNIGTQLADIIEQVQRLIPAFESVHEGMQSQSIGASQITESIIQLNEAAQQTTESLRQSNESISRLNDAAHGLQDGISVFTINSD